MLEFYFYLATVVIDNTFVRRVWSLAASLTSNPYSNLVWTIRISPILVIYRYRSIQMVLKIQVVIVGRLMGCTASPG